VTPLAATSTPPVAPSSGGGPRSAPSTDSERSAFAQALERRQAQRAGSDAPRSGSAPAADDQSDRTPTPATMDDAEATTSVERPDPLAVEPPTATVVDAQAPVWPPVGLAALLGFPADAASADAAMDSSDPMPRSGPMAGAMPPLATPAGTAAPASALAETALPADEAALPMPALAADTAAPVERNEPAPLAFALPAPAALREPAPLLAAPLPAPEVGADDFEARFGAQLQWMAEQKIGHARIRVTPHDLGPVEVRLHLDGDRIRAEFVSPQAETRQALEQGLPRLRDLLGEHGFQLAHAGVGSGHAGGGEAGAGNPSPDDGLSGSAHGGTDAGMSSPPTVQRTLGLLDAYA